MELSKQQTKHLKGLAHALRPVVMLGQHGLSEGVINEIINSLDIHEIIKVQIGGGDKAERKELTQKIEQQTDCTTVTLIGKQAVFYKPSKKNITELPK